MTCIVFKKKYFLFSVFVFSLYVCFSGTVAYGQNEGDLYANPVYLTEIPPVPEFNPHILNCFRKEGYYIHVKEFLCPVGEKESLLSPELTVPTTYGRHLDWEPASHIGFPPPMPVCPSNGAVITKSNYSDDEIELLTMAVNTDEYKALYAAKHASYFLYAELNRILELDEENRWWYLLHATWEADHCAVKDKYTLYALKTVEAAQKRLEKLSEKENEYWVLNVVIPNLYRRTGDFDAAQNWLENLEIKISKGEKPTESFDTALHLLRKAVKEKNTNQIPLRLED